VAGPTVLLAILNSLRMGFKTLAIQKRSSEIWDLLGAVKTEFGKYGDVLDKVQKKLTEASNQIEKVSSRKRAIDRKLAGVEHARPGGAAASADRGGRRPLRGRTRRGRIAERESAAHRQRLAHAGTCCALPVPQPPACGTVSANGITGRGQRDAFSSIDALAHVSRLDEGNHRRISGIKRLLSFTTYRC
jgi:hypothetical protein